MASESCAAIGEQQKVLKLFRAGNSKAEIARELGKEKKDVAKLLAQAIREIGNVQ